MNTKYSFIAEDNTEMTFEFVNEIFGCQRFKITVEGQPERLMVLSGADTQSHYKTLEILLAWGMHHFNSLRLWEDFVEYHDAD